AYHSYDEIDFSASPAKLKASGEPLREEVEKMSKSKKNVVSPDDIIARYGADAMRLYEMFMGDFEQPKPWDMRAVEGITRFLQKIWRLAEGVRAGKTVADGVHLRARHKTIQAVTERVENFKFNTAIAALMEFANLLSGGASRSDVETLALLLSPFAPHLAEEIWEAAGKKGYISAAAWPAADPAHLKDDSVEYPVQINGKLRDKLRAATTATEEEVLAAARALPKVQEFLKNQEVLKEIFIAGRMVSFVSRPQNGK
ncbi:MAG TPA: class I tRNA ligase family protein, partial [Elusimicrobiota bacterium]|nr:class I tRNA ligase family protein [Elusimicrobiota bacterium]